MNCENNKFYPDYTIYITTPHQGAVVKVVVMVVKVKNIAEFL